MTKIRYILLTLVIGVFMAACNTNGCLENRSSVPLAGFYNDRDSAKITLDSLQIYGVGKPESDPLSAAGKAISQVYLPMRSTQQQTSWVIAYKWRDLDFPEANDTITFDYSSQAYFVSDECGVIYKYTIERMTHTSHLISGIQITDSLITNTDIERIKIYFRTAQEEPEE